MEALASTHWNDNSSKKWHPTTGELDPPLKNNNAAKAVPEIIEVAVEGAVDLRGEDEEEEETSEDIRELEDNSLRSHGVQEDLLKHIQSLVSSITEQNRKDRLDYLINVGLNCKGKLREGLVSSGRCDLFAVEAYELSAEVCMDASNFAELLKTLTILITQIYPALIASRDQKKLSRRIEMTSYYLLYFLCFSSNLTLPCGDGWTVQHILSRFTAEELKDPQVSLALQLLKTLRLDFNYIQYARLWKLASPRSRIFLREIDLKILLLWGEGDEKDGEDAWKMFVEENAKATNAPRICLDAGTVHFRIPSKGRKTGAVQAG
ncbi:hypothetical protein HDU67_002461 [Dinochytrium kinnereticum]|nr:hypothetical protein HDU67_002461 [Dinochytrium kinnereticum]